MIATHNIKVNGSWYRAGENIPDPVEKVQKRAEKTKEKEKPVATKPVEEKPEEVKPEATEPEKVKEETVKPKTEEPKTEKSEMRSRNANRRKNGK